MRLWREMSPSTSRWSVGASRGSPAALLLARSGRRVAVVEARRIGKGETGKTTAHLTEALDVSYEKLMSRFGADGARLAAAGQRAAIERIATFAEECAIACDFRRVSGYAFAETKAERAVLEREAAIARKLGVAAALVDRAPLPFPIAGALRFDNQATIHPRLYLQGLERAFVAMRGQIFEDTQVVAIDEGEPCRVISDRGVVSARDVIVAAHVPIVNRFLLHAKLAAYRTYVLGIELRRRTPGVGDGLYWDMAEPYHYICARRRSAGAATCIVGGEDHKVGEADDTTAPFERLEAYVRVHFGREVAADRLPVVRADRDVGGRAAVRRAQFALARRLRRDRLRGQRHHAGDAGGDGAGRRDLRRGQSLRRAAGRHAHQAARFGGRGAVGEPGLPEAHAGRSSRRRRRRRGGSRGDPARRGARAVARRRAAGGLPQRQRAARQRCRRCARTSAASFTGTPPRRAGTARATAAASIRTGACLNGPAVAALEAKPIPGLAAEREREQEAESPTHDLHEHAATD